MTQNIYDRPSFFESYSKYPRMVQGGIAGASEWPLLETMLPPSLVNKTVLDLGCGDGWFSRWALDKGARSVCAMDVSQNMLSRALSLSPSDKYSGITFRQVDIDNFSDEPQIEEEGKYDVAFSGLALHYLVNLEAALRQVFGSLKPGGLFVFSVEHPIFTAPRRPGFNKSKSETEESHQDWLLSSYFAEGEREVDWLGAPVRKQHRTISSYLKTLRAVGFEVVVVDEWGVSDDDSRKHPDWPNDGGIPRFLLISAMKRVDGAK
ncbi:S-adenosyl-L-methionine-dependent methyltransferase [Sordaria brevicollis]|uniref:S-adenosyl-L-methionine-dependent methyltransferase n=1 Tax=Sordaria brevicollis TaxID=83679 RepID=A0AAE0PLS6_SORBR|nr:S-adenosyl-L-methionine-dependent methyltransferase [Sordaria brevicollis]